MLRCKAVSATSPIKVNSGGFDAGVGQLNLKDGENHKGEGSVPANYQGNIVSSFTTSCATSELPQMHFGSSSVKQGM